MYSIKYHFPFQFQTIIPYLQEEVYFLFVGFEEQLTELNINYLTLQYITDGVAYADFEANFIQSVIPAGIQNSRSRLLWQMQLVSRQTSTCQIPRQVWSTCLCPHLWKKWLRMYIFYPRPHFFWQRITSLTTGLLHMQASFPALLRPQLEQCGWHTVVSALGNHTLHITDSQNNFRHIHAPQNAQSSDKLKVNNLQNPPLRCVSHIREYIDKNSL